jgi:multiple antibiotic resistance protein
MLSAVVVLTLLIIFLFFSFAKLAEQRIDDMVFSVLIRVFGILVVAIGSQFILEGLGEVFPAFMEGGAAESDIKDDVNNEQDTDN